MKAEEWAIVGAFVGVIYAVSLWNETVAAMLAGAALIVAFVDSGLAKRFTAATGGTSGTTGAGQGV